MLSCESQSEKVIALNKDVYEFLSNSLTYNGRAQMTQIFTLKSAPHFLFAHQSNIISDSAIYIKVSSDKYLSTDKYNKHCDLSSVIGGTAINDECLLLSHQD